MLGHRVYYYLKSCTDFIVYDVSYRNKLSQSTKIIDVSGDEPVYYRGQIPARSVVIPGSIQKEFTAGKFGVNCALIIGIRKASTDKKTSLNDVLRDFQVPV